MLPLFKWEAGNIGRQRKQFIKQKIWNNIKVSSSKQVYVTNSYVKYPKPWCHIEIKIPLHRNFFALNIVRLKIVNVFCMKLWVPKSSFISLPVLIYEFIYLYIYIYLIYLYINYINIYAHINIVIIKSSKESFWSATDETKK